MTVAVIGAVLAADASVTALVPAENIEALRRTQGLGIPAITITNVSNVPLNHLRGWGGLDQNQVQVDVFAANYTSALQIAAAVRTALEAADYQLELSLERNEPETDPELFQITQTWSVYV